MDINTIEIPYQFDFLLNLFQSISNQPWSILLYSGNNGHPDGRFDILVTAPKVTLITHNKTTRINSKHHYQTSNEDPFKILKQQLNNTKIKIKTNSQLPFQGGLLGIFGYDLIRRLFDQKIPKISKKDINLPDMAIGLYNWAIITDHYLCKITIISHDNPQKILSWIKKQKTKNKYQSFILQGNWTTNLNYKNYIKKFQKIKQYLKNGECYQVCLSQRFCAPYAGNEWPAFYHLIKYNKAPFSAFIKLNNQSVICLSPERFICLKNKLIQTKPIKGTILRNHDKIIDQKQILNLITSSKDKSENLMIVDLLRNDIGRIAIPGSVKVPKLFSIESFPAIHHMVSTITGVLANNYSATDVLKLCFPGGSITGAPKISAMKIIEELEPKRRNVYFGSIAYLSYCGNMDSNIIIRTLITEKQHILCSIGSAIGIDSKENLEYQEILNKASTILPLFKKPIYYK